MADRAGGAAHGTGRQRRAGRPGRDSPPHLTTILYPAFNYVGIGAATDAAGYVYVTQDFADILPPPAVPSGPKPAPAAKPARAPQPAKAPAPAPHAAAAQPAIPMVVE